MKVFSRSKICPDPCKRGLTFIGNTQKLMVCKKKRLNNINVFLNILNIYLDIFSNLSDMSNIASLGSVLMYHCFVHRLC